ncbi:MAG: putative ABC transporter permease [Clostridia bacterium]
MIETLFGIATKDVWESRQSFLYGFCGIYGIGAITITLLSRYLNKNKLTLFVGGFLVGSVTEYTISFLVDTILHTKWSDYSNRFLNINGRICLLYSVFWGVLTLFLIKIINPKIDILIAKIKDKISIKKLKLIILIVIIFLAIDCIATCYAQKQFVNRMIVNDRAIKQEKVIENYNKTYNNKVLSDFINTFWNDKKMIRTFPNIKIEDKII